MQLLGEEQTKSTHLEKTAIIHNVNNNLVNDLDSVKLRTTGSKHLTNGRLSPARERSPLRGTADGSSALPQAVYDRLKTLTSVAQTAEDQLRELQTTLRDTLREGRLPLAQETASWSIHGSPEEAPLKSRSPKNGSPDKRQLRDKQFALRNSPLTDLFSINHISTIYHVAVVVLIILVLKTLVHDLVTHGTVNMSVGLIWYAFGGFHRVITIWMVMMLAVMLQYTMFANWAQRRQQLAQSALVVRCWDAAFLLLLVAFDVALLTVPVLRMLHYSMPFASSFALLTESVRLLMKSHAFVRSNVVRALKDGSCPGFSHFLYFMFAPTLVYSDSYPRTSHIRWRVVACHLLEVVGCIFYISFLSERYLLPLYQGFGLEAMSLSSLVSTMMAAVLPSGLSFVCSFYLLLHSWQNAWAEMLRFGDRMFYMDWWNQGTFPSWYRTWNVLVQDWLYTYVYKDVVLMGGSGLVARSSVFFISAAVHEYILAFTLRFFFPALYLFFGIIGFFLSFLGSNQQSSSIGNIGLWLSLFLGDGILITLYSIEHFARENCAQVIDSSWDLFIPRSWNCVGINSVAQAS